MASLTRADYLDDGTAYLARSIQIPAGFTRLYYRLFSGASYAALRASARGPDMVVGAQQPVQLTVARARQLEMAEVDPAEPVPVDVLYGANLQPSDRVTFADAWTGAVVRRTRLGDTGVSLTAADVSFVMAAPDVPGLYMTALSRADANGQDGPLLAGGPYLNVTLSGPPPPSGTDITQYYDVDAVGSVRRITQVGTSAVIRKDYQPFGAAYGSTTASAIGDRVQFAGKELQEPIAAGQKPAGEPRDRGPRGPQGSRPVQAPQKPAAQSSGGAMAAAFAKLRG